MVAIEIDLDACEGCGNCVEVCPTEVYQLNGQNKSEPVSPEECIECCACVEDCPQEAIIHETC